MLLLLLGEVDNCLVESVEVEERLEVHPKMKRDERMDSIEDGGKSNLKLVRLEVNFSRFCGSRFICTSRDSSPKSSFK